MRHLFSRGLGALVLVVSAVALTSCGGGGSSTSTGSSSTTTAVSGGNFLAQADQVCQRATQEGVATKTITPTTARLNKVGEIGKQEISDFMKLTPPASQRATFDALISNLQKVTDLTGQIGGAITANDAPLIQSLTAQLQVLGPPTKAEFAQLGVRCQ
jgi:hypothetical protein